MEVKMGVVNDYDLMANAESSARKPVACAICDASPITFRWSDLSGEAMCCRCGCPYQLKWGTEAQETEGAYPYLQLRPEVVPVFRRYFAETHRFATLGTMMGPRPGLGDLHDWLDAHRTDADVVAAFGPPEAPDATD